VFFFFFSIPYEEKCSVHSFPFGRELLFPKRPSIPSSPLPCEFDPCGEPPLQAFPVHTGAEHRRSPFLSLSQNSATQSFSPLPCLAPRALHTGYFVFFGGGFVFFCGWECHCPMFLFFLNSVSRSGYFCSSACQTALYLSLLIHSCYAQKTCCRLVKQFDEIFLFSSHRGRERPLFSPFLFSPDARKTTSPPGLSLFRWAPKEERSLTEKIYGNPLPPFHKDRLPPLAHWKPLLLHFNFFSESFFKRYTIPSARQCHRDLFLLLKTFSFSRSFPPFDPPPH